MAGRDVPAGAVTPAHRRRGIARALVAEAERRVTDRGAQRVSALVLGATDNAIAFWEALGYTRHEDIQRHVRTLH